MFERFTDRARRVLVYAQDEAGSLGHNFIGTEHILLGLVREGEGVAATVLNRSGVQLDAVRAEVTARLPSKPTVRRNAKPPFTPRAKKVLELSLREALQLGHNYIGTEHILLGLVREGEGVAVQVLDSLGLKPPEVRELVMRVLTDYGTTKRGGLPAAQHRHSPALSRALIDADLQAREEALVTTSHVIRSILGVADSQGAIALAGLDVTAERFEGEVASVAIERTSDSPPEVRKVEIKLGDVTTTITDPDLALALRRASPEQIKAALAHLVTDPEAPTGEAPEPGDGEVDAG